MNACSTKHCKITQLIRGRHIFITQRLTSERGCFHEHPKPSAHQPKPELTPVISPPSRPIQHDAQIHIPAHKPRFGPLKKLLENLESMARISACSGAAEPIVFPIMTY